MVSGEVAFRQIHGGVGLVVQAVVDLRRITQVDAIFAVDDPVRAAVVAPLIKRPRDGSSRLIRKSVRLSNRKFIERGRVHGLRLMLALPFQGKEAEELVLLKWSPQRPSKLLACIVRVRANRAVWVSGRGACASGIFLVRVQI